MEVQKQAGVLTAGKPTAEQLEKINLQAKTPLAAEEVYVFSVRLCDDQPDRDHERFSTEALPKLAELFVGKTGVADHAWSSEKQLARIFETGVEYGDGAAFIRAWAYILRTDKTAELIREKALRNLSDEIPHGIAVTIESFTERRNGLMDIQATIVCERESHKGIIIGKKGAMLKKIGSQARYEIEALMGTQVNLQIWVKVRKEWRDNELYLKNYGYRSDDVK